MGATAAADVAAVDAIGAGARAGAAVVREGVSEFAKSVTKETAAKSLAIGMQAAGEMQGSLVTAGRIVGADAAIVAESQATGGLMLQFEKILEAAMATIK